MEIEVVNSSNLPLPKYAHDGDAGMDLRAMIGEDEVLMPMERMLVPTGISMKIPKGYEGQVRGRSGLALRYGIGIVNGVGTIDSGFVGDIGVMLINFGEESFTISKGDRIAQLVIASVEQPTLTMVESLESTTRGCKGYGSSGVK